MKIFIILTLLFILAVECINSQNEKNSNYYGFYSIVSVDVKPEFPGGHDSLKSFFSENRDIFQDLFQIDYSDIVCFCFVIDTNGNACQYHIPNNIPEVFQRKLAVLFNRMPKWEPGMKNNRKVNTLICFPFLFYKI